MTALRRFDLPVAIVGIAFAVFGTLWLDATSGENLMRHTISAYVFTNPVLFTTVVIGLVLGSAAVLAGLISRGVIGARSVSTYLLGAWIVGLATVAVFPKHDWSVGPSISGHIHRVGSMVAFVAFPLAVLLLTRAVVRRGAGWVGWLAGGLAAASYGYLGYLGWKVFEAAQTGQRWFSAVPLGLSERILLAFEVAALIALAFAMHRANRVNSDVEPTRERELLNA